MAQWTVPAKVIEVIDGDTVRLTLDLGWHITFVARVRLAKINAPELSTTDGAKAKEFAQTLLKVGDEVTFVSKGFDKYGRPLGHILFGGFANRDFGEEMVVHGYAQRVDW